MINLNQQLIKASENGDLDNIKYLVENGANIHAQDDYVLRYSSRYGYLDIVKCLVENGANIHTQDDCALRWSIQGGYLDIVKYLVENGADIHADNDYALWWSVCSNYLEIVKYLIENGADQKVLFKKWSKQKIAKVFEIDNEPIKQHTNELCSESFELPKKDDWYVIWKDDSISIFENLHLASVEPELVKGIYIQC